ncbi:MAG TPA: DUF1206 domain-containing protein [Pedococcus sp.]|jgi:hypothetical protein
MSDLAQTARQASDHPALETAARVGYAISGVLHLLIGWIALQVAWAGGGGQKADQGGALQTLAGNGVGQALLWVGVLGFLGLGLWQLADGAVGHPGSGTDAWGRRVKAFAKAAVYLVLAWTTFGFARGKQSDSKEQTVDFTATLMEQPGGRWLVALVGLTVIGVGAYHVHKGATKRFLRDLEEHPGQWATKAGVVGYVAKGAALAVVGILFVTAALHGNAKEASGLDGALRTLKEQPFGPALLTAVAAGLVAYGLYSFSRSRHARV